MNTIVEPCSYLTTSPKIMRNCYLSPFPLSSKPLRKSYATHTPLECSSCPFGPPRTPYYDADRNLGNDWTQTYAYYARHRRVAAFYGPPNGPGTVHDSRNLFVYDGWNVLYEQEDVQYGNVWERHQDIDYFWGLDLSGTLQGAGGVGGLIAVSIAGQYYFPCDDNMGNIVAYVDEAGTTVASYSRRHGDRPIWNLCRFFSGGWTVRGGQW